MSYKVMGVTAGRKDSNSEILLKEALLKQFGAQTVIIGEIGPVIGAHAGPGTIALFYLGKSREGDPADG